jgi:hypothetical protein
MTNVEVERLLKDATYEADRGARIAPVGLIVKAVQLLNEDIGELAVEHSSTAHMAATVDPGLLARVTELERLTGMLVKSVGALASSPQPKSTGRSPDGAWPFIAELDHGDRPATYGPVPSPYGRPSPAYAVDQVTKATNYATGTYGMAPDEYVGVEDASVEYVRGEPTLKVQVSGVLYRFHAPDVLSNKGDM